MPELGNTNFEPVPFGGTNPGFPEPPHELQKDIKEMLLFYNTPGDTPDGNPVGGGFLDFLTTNFENNKACAVNSLVIANVRKYCKELQKHPKLKGKSCEEIILILTQEMYVLYNFEISNFPGEPLRSREVPGHGVTTTDVIQYLLPAKRRLMKGYGVDLKKKRIFGINPPTGLPIPGVPVPPSDPSPPGDPAGPGWGPEEIEMLPSGVQNWHGGGGWRSGGGMGTRPPENSPYGASACCPPIGCDVIVGYIANGPSGTFNHMVAGKIIECHPDLTIACEEHPLQSGHEYNLYVRPPNPSGMNIDGLFYPGGPSSTTNGSRGTGGIVEAELVLDGTTAQSVSDRTTGNASLGGQVEILFIICLC